MSACPALDDRRQAPASTGLSIWRASRLPAMGLGLKRRAPSRPASVGGEHPETLRPRRSKPIPVRYPAAGTAATVPAPLRPRPAAAFRATRVTVMNRQPATSATCSVPSPLPESGKNHSPARTPADHAWNQARQGADDDAFRFVGGDDDAQHGTEILRLGWPISWGRA